MLVYISTIAYLATFLLAIGIIGNTTVRRVGGIRFIRCGRVCASVCVAKQKEHHQ